MDITTKTHETLRDEYDALLYDHEAALRYGKHNWMVMEAKSMLAAWALQHPEYDTRLHTFAGDLLDIAFRIHLSKQ